MTEAQQLARNRLYSELYDYSKRQERKRLIAKYLTIEQSRDGYCWHVKYKGWSLGCWSKYSHNNSRRIIQVACDLLYAMELHGDIKPKEANDGQSQTL